MAYVPEICDRLDECIIADCDNYSVAGVQETVILFELSNTTITDVTGKPSQISAFVTTTPALAFTGTRKSFDASNEASWSDFEQAQHVHTMNGRVLTIDNTTSEKMRKMQNSTFIAVVFTNNKTIEVFGVRVGLKATITKNTMENNGTALAALKTIDGYFEPYPWYTYVGNGTDSFEAMKDDLFALVTCP